MSSLQKVLDVYLAFAKEYPSDFAFGYYLDLTPEEKYESAILRQDLNRLVSLNFAVRKAWIRQIAFTHNLHCPNNFWSK